MSDYGSIKITFKNKVNKKFINKKFIGKKKFNKKRSKRTIVSNKQVKFATDEDIWSYIVENSNLLYKIIHKKIYYDKDDILQDSFIEIFNILKNRKIYLNYSKENGYSIPISRIFNWGVRNVLYNNSKKYNKEKEVIDKLIEIEKNKVM